jgi:hypothetical protein
MKNKKNESGERLKVKIHIFFHGDRSWTAGLRKMKFGTVKDHGYTYKFYLNNCLV